jgi:hypothetical protein
MCKKGERSKREKRRKNIHRISRPRKKHVLYVKISTTEVNDRKFSYRHFYEVS